MTVFSYRSSYCDNDEDQMELDRFTDFMEESADNSTYEDIETLFEVECEDLVDEDLKGFVQGSLDGIALDCSTARLTQEEKGFMVKWE